MSYAVRLVFPVRVDRVRTETTDRVCMAEIRYNIPVSSRWDTRGYGIHGIHSQQLGFGFANMFPKLGAIHAIPDGLTLCTNTQHLHMHMFSQLCDCWFCIKTVKKHKQYVMD